MWERTFILRFFLFSGKENSCWYTIRKTKKLPVTIQTIPPLPAGHCRRSGRAVPSPAAIVVRTLPTGSSAIAEGVPAYSPAPKCAVYLRCSHHRKALAFRQSHLPHRHGIVRKNCASVLEARYEWYG